MRSARRRTAHFATLVFLAMVVLVLPAKAQSTDSDPLGAAFTEMMLHPNDANAALGYARLAAERGRPQAAIPALERILRANPDLDQIRLELASLYLATGSADLAAIYAQQALQSPNIPPDVAVRARALLAEAEQGSARSLFQAQIFTGFRHDSNANAATTQSTVNVFSPIFGTLPVTPSIRGQPDWSFAGNGAMTHLYDLGLQTEASWETNASVSGQLFFTIPRYYDLLVMQLDTGPRFGLGRIGEAALYIRPFFTTTWLAFDGATYALLYGGGVSAQARAPRWSVTIAGQGQAGDYQDSSFRPMTRPYTGAEGRITLSGQYKPLPGTTLALTVVYYKAGCQIDAYCRAGPGLTASGTQTLSLFGEALEVGAHAGVQRLQYGGANAAIDPFHTRTDALVDAGLYVAIPIALGVPKVRQVSLVAQYGYLWNSSTYQIYQYTDHVFTLGLRADF
jgi:hypothetical protein